MEVLERNYHKNILATFKKTGGSFKLRAFFLKNAETTSQNESTESNKSNT